MSQKLINLQEIAGNANINVFKTPFSNFSGQNLKICLDCSNFICLPWQNTEMFKIGFQEVGSHFLHEVKYLMGVFGSGHRRRVGKLSH